jgi:hypothetical protein
MFGLRGLLAANICTTNGVADLSLRLQRPVWRQDVELRCTKVGGRALASLNQEQVDAL